MSNTDRYLNYLTELAALNRWLFKKVSTGNRKAIRDYIHRLMSNNKNNLSRADKINLAQIFHSRDVSTKDLAKAASTAGRKIEKYKAKLKSMPQKGLKDTLKRKKMERRITAIRNKKIIPYHKYVDKDPEEYVEITFGGGKRFLKDFMSKKNKGYRLERGGKGIQVTPQEVGIKGTSTGNRAASYAQRAAGRMFDSPVVLKAKIKRKHLQAANNKYEAALSSDVIGKLKDVKIKDIDFDPGHIPV